MGRRLKVLFTLALPLAGAIALVAWMLGVDPRGPSTPEFAYETSDVTRGEIRRLVSTSGPVRARVTVSIGSQLSGQVEELLVDFNSEVKAGDVLARLDAKTYAARVAQAKADLAAARAMLLNQEATMKKAEAVLRNAERLMTRQQTLATRGITAPATLDVAQRDMEVASADIAVMTAQIENARAQIAQREAALRAAEIDLDRATIRSPIDGTVISRTIDIGQTVAASLQAPELFKIAQDLRRIRIEAQVNEADVGIVQEGHKVEFTVDAYPERKFEGVVTQVRLAAVELQNVVTYTVIIEAANDDRRLYPGMTANVLIETARRDDVLRVASDALRFVPRDQPAGTADRAAQRVTRLLEQLKTNLKLDDAQMARVGEEAQRIGREMAAQRAAGGAAGGGAAGGGAPAGGEGEQQGGRFMAQIEQVLVPLLTDAQRPLFQRWKTQRAAIRTGRVWIAGEKGQLEARMVRIGIADERSTEILGGPLKAGDKVVTKARRATKR